MLNDVTLTELQVDSDEALFDSATADSPADTPEVTDAPADTAEPDATAQPRDESGRFAPKAGEQPVETQAASATPTTEADGGQIPAWRLREEAENRRAAEARAQQFERELTELRRNPPKPAEPAKPETKPDPLLDPDGYESYVLSKVEARFAAAEEARIKERGEHSFQAAHDADKATFDKAIAEVTPLIKGGDAATYNRIWKASDPGKALVSWYRERETLREVGSDPVAYKQRLLDEALKDPAYLAKAVAAARAPAQPAAARQPSPVRLPPSLSSATPSGAAIGSDDGDISDEGLFAHATAGMGR